jgi:hypothetical protein
MEQQPPETEQITPQHEAFDAIWTTVCAIAMKVGAAPLNQWPGLWRFDVDEHWKIAVNAHDEEIEGIPKFRLYAEWNGWPAGMLSPTGGEIAAGTLANIFTLREALDRKLIAIAVFTLDAENIDPSHV